MNNFVHLHLHSEYSLLDGACSVNEIPKIAKELGHSAVAITDHGAMYGVPEFYTACKKEGVKPIIGCEVYIAPNSRFDRTKVNNVTGYHLVLLVKNEIGYKNLIYMVTKAFTEGFYSKPRIDEELLQEHCEGLVALSGCIAGKLSRLILANEYDKAKAHALEMRELFGEDNYYLEIQDHGIDDERIVRNYLLRLHRETGIGLVATGDVHYLRKADADTQAILMCIQTGNTIKDGRPIGFEKDEYYYKSTEEMTELFAEFPDAVANTVKIAEICNFELDFSGRYLPTFTPPDGSSPEEYLKKLTYAGLEERTNSGVLSFDNTHSREEYIQRIEYELNVINSMGFAEYYLVVRDFVGFAKSQKIPVGPGRGSGAGSLVAYLNYITDVDSIKYGLLFERFLNPERVSMPDFDIDFCYNRRDEVIEYVKRKYGEDRVSQIIAFATLAARAAVRDVGRALAMPYSAVDEIAALIPRDLNVTIKGLLDGNVKLKKQNTAPEAIRRFKEAYESSYENKRLIDTALALEGKPRHTQVHAAGVVITDKPVYEYVPLALSKGATVTQYDMEKASGIGLVKFDFLALRYLTVISDAEKLIKQKEPDFDIEKISLDDEKTYKFISDGNSDGLFQLESPGMKRLLLGLRPKNIEDITAAISLYRPGPMDSIPEYLKNRENPENITYKIPALKPILDVTYGCIIYQEQVMSICREVAGYSLGRADIVRRMMAKKKTAEMQKEREIFVEGALKRGVSEACANELYDRLAKFASYAFNKSHAVAYSILAYRTAYLKCRYTGEYMAALLTSVLGNIPKTAEYIEQSSKYGVKILPPDINKSFADFTVQDGQIRFGMAAIKNVGYSFIEGIVEERKNGVFTSFDDFISRMCRRDINKRQVESLIKCGAFDCFGIYRSRLLVSFELMIDECLQKERSNSAGQLDLFAEFDENNSDGIFKYPEIDELPLRDLLKFEKECAGLYFSGHILDNYKAHIEKLGAVSSAHLSPEYYRDEEGLDSEPIYENNSEVTVAGIITDKTVKNTRSGDKMMFLTLEDSTGELELIAFAKILDKYAEYLVCDVPVAVRGRLSLREEETAKVIIYELIPLVSSNSAEFPEFAPKRTVEAVQSAVKPAAVEQKKSQDIKRLFIKVSDTETKDYKNAVTLCEIFEGRTPAVFYDAANQTYLKDNVKYVEVSDYLLCELKSFLGDSNVVFK